MSKVNWSGDREALGVTSYSMEYRGEGTSPYMGYYLLMSPDDFLSLTAPRMGSSLPAAQSLFRFIESDPDMPIGTPMLFVEEVEEDGEDEMMAEMMAQLRDDVGWHSYPRRDPDPLHLKATSHEGRGRAMYARLVGDEVLPVHIYVRHRDWGNMRMVGKRLREFESPAEYFLPIVGEDGSARSSYFYRAFYPDVAMVGKKTFTRSSYPNLLAKGRWQDSAELMRSAPGYEEMLRTNPKAPTRKIKPREGYEYGGHGVKIGGRSIKVDEYVPRKNPRHTIGMPKERLVLLERLSLAYKSSDDFGEADLKGTGGKTVNYLVNYIDTNSRNRLNLQAIRDELVQGGDWYYLHKIDVKDVDANTHGQVKPSGKEDLTKPIVTNHKGEVIDGRHRVTLARKRGVKQLPAYIPAKLLYENEFGLYRPRKNPSLRITDAQDRAVEVVDSKQIGKGMFKRVFKSKKKRADGRDVVVISDENNFDHEIMASVCREYRSRHIPCTEFVGWIGDERVYTMKFYKTPLRKADSAKAWAQYRLLKEASEKAGWGGANVHESYKTFRKTIDIYKRMKGHSKAIVRALETIERHVSNYGPTYRWEFTPRNLGTDKSGNLILLDPFFDALQASRIRAAQMKRAQEAARRW